MSKPEIFTMAAIQAEPEYYDRESSTEKACSLILEAGRRGANIAAFGESWLPGYPMHAFSEKGKHSGFWDDAISYIDNAVEVPSPTTNRLCAAAKQAKVDVVIGIAERDTVSKSTIYCSLLFISSDGELLGVHRKIKPTFNERIVWGEGDGSSLVTYNRAYGKISGLNCWEHNMMLPGYALARQGTNIHVAAWPGTDQTIPDPINFNTRQLYLSQAFASQTGSYVILVGGLCKRDGFPMEGGSRIINPRGVVIAGPASGEEIILADGNQKSIQAAKIACDITGHYSRPDIFEFQVNKEPIRYEFSKDLQESESDISRDADDAGSSLDFVKD